MSKIKLTVILSLFIDILGLTIIIPALPNLVTYYNTTYFVISLWITLFSLFWLFSTPILGALSDKYWRKPVLLISIFTDVIAYFLIRISGNVRLYLIARIVSWIAAWNISSIQSILSDISKDQKDRTSNLWLFWAIFWIWFIIWPALWWFLLNFGIKMPFLISMILCIINMIAIVFWLPETNKVMNKILKIKVNIVHIFKDMFVSKEKKYYLIFLIVNLAIMIYQMSFTLYLYQHFNISWEKSWFILAWFGILMAINQWLLLKKFWLNRFSNKTLVSISLIWMILCYAWAFFFHSLIAVVWLIAISAIFQWIFRPVFQNIILWDNKDVGLINWNIASISNLTSIFGPIIWGYLIWVWISPFGIIAILIAIAYFYSKRVCPTKLA